MMLMIPDGRADPAFSAQHALLNNLAPIVEVQDAMAREGGCSSYWKGFAKEIKVPVMSIIGEYDGLWDTSRAAIEEFAKAFQKTTVEWSIVPDGPHCIELSYQGKSVLVKVLGFSMQCAIAADLKAKAKKKAT